MSDSSELFLRFAGNEEKVVAQRLPDGTFRIDIGERGYHVDARADGEALSLLIDGQAAEAFVAGPSSASAPGSYFVACDEFAGSVEVLSSLQRLAESAGAGSGQRGANRVVASMPGRVVSLLAAEGETVIAGQGVMVIEAMKMENEIASELEGVVAQILVEPGQAVESGDELFVVEARSEAT